MYKQKTTYKQKTNLELVKAEAVMTAFLGIGFWSSHRTRLARRETEVDHCEGLKVGDTIYYLETETGEVEKEECVLVVNGIGYSISQGFDSQYHEITPMKLYEGYYLNDPLGPVRESGSDKEWLDNARKLIEAIDSEGGE